jgi:short-chain fatty acids transporter
LALILIAVSVGIAHVSAPSPDWAKSMKDMGLIYASVQSSAGNPETPGEWLEHSPLLSIFISGCGAAYLYATVRDKGWTELLELNNYIFIFLIAGLLLHWRPRSFLRSVQASVPATAGIIIQYPLYAGILKMLTESGLASSLARLFTAAATEKTFPLVVGVYSAALGVFVPSGGGKWLIEAPYLLEAAKTLGAHAGWVVQAYNACEALPNLVHPFFMLPLLGLLGLKARDIVGYTTLQLAVHLPLVLFLVWALNLTLHP